MGKEKKEYMSFYLEKSFVKRIEALVDDPNTIFDDKSSFLRFCAKQQIPLAEEEVKQQRRG